MLSIILQANRSQRRFYVITHLVLDLNLDLNLDISDTVLGKNILSSRRIQALNRKHAVLLANAFSALDFFFPSTDYNDLPSDADE